MSFIFTYVFTFLILPIPFCKITFPSDITSLGWRAYFSISYTASFLALIIYLSIKGLYFALIFFEDISSGYRIHFWVCFYFQYFKVGNPLSCGLPSFRWEVLHHSYLYSSAQNVFSLSLAAFQTSSLFLVSDILIMLWFVKITWVFVCLFAF